MRNAFRYQEVRGAAYTSALYVREDNYFLADPMLDRHPIAPGVVYVDAFCGFGAHSDKVHYGSFSTMTTLLSDGEAMIGFWLGGGTTSYQSTEHFLTQWMTVHDLTATPVDFLRADVRYCSGRLCTPSIYASCTSVTAARRFPVCPLAAHGKVLNQRRRT